MVQRSKKSNPALTEQSFSNLVIRPALNDSRNTEITRQATLPELPKECKFFDRLTANYTAETVYEHSVFRYLRSLESNKASLTIKAYHTQVMAALRDFLYTDYDLPSPEFDDLAAFLVASEVCRCADTKQKEGKLTKREQAELEACLGSGGTALQHGSGNKMGHQSLKAFLPDFQFKRTNGKLKMTLRGERFKFPRSELKRDDETVLNIILSMLEQEKGRSLWPHFYKLDVIGHVIGIGKTVRNNRPATLNLRHSALSSLEEYLYHSNELRQFPVMMHLDRMRNPVQQKPVLSEKQIETILRYAEDKSKEAVKILNRPANRTNLALWRKHFPDIRNLAMLAILDYTVLRAGAICDIKIKDLSADTTQLHVPHEKGGKNRILDLNPFAKKAVKQCLKMHTQFLLLNNLNLRDQQVLFVSKWARPFNPRHFDESQEIPLEPYLDSESCGTSRL